MSSAAQQTANRENSRHSTGPRTSEGKATVSQNANRHNLTGRLRITDDEKEAFDEFEQAHRAQISPTGALELNLFEMLIAAGWNLQRIEALQSDSLANADFPQLDRLCRYRNQHERAFYRALAELKALQTAREIQQRLANPNKPNVLPLTDLAQVKRIGFVLSPPEKASADVSQMLKDYLFASPPLQ